MGHVKANCPWGFPAVFFYLGAQLSQNLPLLRKTSLGSDSGRGGEPSSSPVPRVRASLPMLKKGK